MELMTRMRGFDVSTHSRLKAAGTRRRTVERLLVVSTHSRLKAAGLPRIPTKHYPRVSTHSRLKAAGLDNMTAAQTKLWFQHTAA